MSKTAYNELTIGITGHLWVNQSPEILDAIDQVFEKIHQVYSYQSIKILSPLAEGADRIIAKQALSLPNTRLVALLPFPVEEYGEDFSSTGSVQEFKKLVDLADRVIELAGSKEREQAYITLGRALLDQSDILIAIWDGQPANGRGGTAEIVHGARERGLPLAWILHKQPKSSGSGMSPSVKGHIEVFFERFP